MRSANHSCPRKVSHSKSSFDKLFKTECGGLAWEEFPKLFELIFDSWLPASEYKQKYDLAIEVLHLWTDHDLRQKNRYYEVWIPVELK